jgi:hypothetical protein
MKISRRTFRVCDITLHFAADSVSKVCREANARFTINSCIRGGRTYPSLPEILNFSRYKDHERITQAEPSLLIAFS